MPEQIIPFCDLGKQYQSIEQDVDQAIKKVLNQGKFILGENVENFESSLAAYCGCQYAVGVASGTDALVISLMTIGVESGDEIITTPFTYIATASAIMRVGARPIFVDIDRETLNIDEHKIENHITKRTKAIIPVHLFGRPCNMRKILEIAKRHNIAVIEDIAQALGATSFNKRVGSFGDVAAGSFFPTKNLGAYGDGGIVLTNNKRIRELADKIRRQGALQKYLHEMVGMNSRLDEIQAAILLVKLKNIDTWNKQRRNIANVYNNELSNTDLTLPIEKEGSYHVYYVYPIITSGYRDQLQKYLMKYGIETAIYYPHGLHEQPALKGLGYTYGDFPICEDICRNIICLPCYPELSVNAQAAICRAIRNYHKGIKQWF